MSCLKYKILLVIFMCQCLCYAQFAPSPDALEKPMQIDKSIIELQYCLKFKKNYKQQTYDVDDRIVQIGEHIIKDYSKIIFHYDSLKTINDKKGLRSSGISGNVFCYELTNDLDKAESFIKYHLALNGGTLCYTSKLPKLEWELSPDSTLDVLGYTCNFAQMHFAGRDYRVWYSIDVPVPYGPYKFYGLPGLVMKVEEKSGLYIWELVGLKNVSSPIMQYTYDAEKKCTELEAQKAIARMQKNPVRFLEQMGRKMYIVGPDGRARPSTAYPQIPDEDFEPLEKY